MLYARPNEVFADKFSFLIVDDQEFMQHLIKETLNSANAGKIDKAMDGIGAIELLRKLKKVDFIICDFNMPKMNGLELLKAIRVGDAHVPRTTPVIMLSGFDDEPLLLSAMELDVSGFIQKPVSKAELVTRMNKLFMSEVSIKDPDEYRAIELPLIEGGFQEIEQPAKKGPSSGGVSEEMKAEGSLTPLKQVAVGSLIVEDVVTENGVKLIDEGSRATERLLDLLIQIKEKTGISAITVCSV